MVLTAHDSFLPMNSTSLPTLQTRYTPMKSTPRFATPLVVATALLTSLAPMRAEIQVNDRAAFGLIGTPNQESITKWPEEVQFSSTLPPKGMPQSYGTHLQNLYHIVKNRDGVEVPAFSRVVAQSFHIPKGSTDQTLEKIFILCQASLRGNHPIKFAVRMVDLGESPNLGEYAAGKNLFPDDSTILIASSTPRKAAQVVGLTFTGNHRITLKKGHTYAFELVLDEQMPSNIYLIWLRGGISPSLPNAPVFSVPFTDASKSTDPRHPVKDRQAFIGIKTSPKN